MGSSPMVRTAATSNRPPRTGTPRLFSATSATACTRNRPTGSTPTTEPTAPGRRSATAPTRCAAPAVSFVQNHPDEPDRAVVYHAPESSEVNVYTRGSAVLKNGLARIDLDPMFAWTAIPDIGLTAHVTPRGAPILLAVEKVGTKELV